MLGHTEIADTLKHESRQFDQELSFNYVANLSDQATTVKSDSKRDQYSGSGSSFGPVTEMNDLDGPTLTTTEETRVIYTTKQTTTVTSSYTTKSQAVTASETTVDDPDEWPFTFVDSDYYKGN